MPINGKSINTFYSYQFKGLDPQFGYPVFYGAELENAEELVKNYNGLTKEQVFSTVMVESGRREPVIQGGISNNFSYRNWLLSFNVTYSLGNKIRLMQIASGNYGTFRPSSQQNLRKEFTERWRYPGMNNIQIYLPYVEVRVFLLTNTRGGMPPARNLIINLRLTITRCMTFSDLRVVKGDYLKPPVCCRCL